MQLASQDRVSFPEQPGELLPSSHSQMPSATLDSLSSPSTVYIAGSSEQASYATYPEDTSNSPPYRQTAFYTQPPSTGPLTPPPTKRIPRPANAFMLFRSDFLRSNHAISDVEKKQQTLSKLAGRVWREMSEEEKGEWRERAEMVKMDHRQKYPDYKFTPTRSSGRPKVKLGEDGDVANWMDTLHSLIEHQSSPVRRNRSLRKQTPVLKPGRTPPASHPGLNAVPLQPTPPFSKPQSPLSLPRRPSSAPGFRPSPALASSPMGFSNPYSSNTDMVISPNVPQFTNISPPRRPSTALGVRTSESNAAGIGQLCMQPPIDNSWLYNQPQPTFSNPFSMDSLSHSVDALNLRDVDLPYAPHAHVSPLQPIPTPLTYPSFVNVHNCSAKATSPTASDMSIDSPARPFDAGFATELSESHTGFFPSFYPSDGSSTGCIDRQYQPLPFSLYQDGGNPFANQDYFLQYPALQ